MKFLIDMPLSPGLARWLVEQGHEADHASDIGLALASDETILSRALLEGRVIITADLDYPRLLATMDLLAPAVVLFRGGAISEIMARGFARRVLAAVPPDALRHSLVVVDQNRVRLRALPLRDAT